MRVLVMCVCTPLVPCQPSPAPEPPAMVYNVSACATESANGADLVVAPAGDDVALRVLAAGAEGQVAAARASAWKGADGQHELCTPLTRRAGVERLEDDVDDALAREHVPAAHGGRRARREERARRDEHCAERISERSEGETADRARRGHAARSRTREAEGGGAAPTTNGTRRESPSSTPARSECPTQP